LDRAPIPFGLEPQNEVSFVIPLSKAYPVDFRRPRFTVGRKAFRKDLFGDRSELRRTFCRVPFLSVRFRAAKCRFMSRFERVRMIFIFRTFTGRSCDLLLVLAPGYSPGDLAILAPAISIPFGLDLSQ
jgi:hypothetical protein